MPNREIEDNKIQANYVYQQRKNYVGGNNSHVPKILFTFAKDHMGAMYTQNIEIT